jgi:pimeloyl-ACP methyl ester carboxylesterase
VFHGDITCASDMATLAEQVLDAAPDRFALAGLSMGGIVAMEVIRQAPHRVTRLALWTRTRAPNCRRSRPGVDRRWTPSAREGWSA